MTSSSSEIRQLERTLSTLLNKQLQQICSVNGLKTSGVKAELQGRIRSALIDSVTANPVFFRQLQTNIRDVVCNITSHTPQPSMAGSSSNSGNRAYNNYAHVKTSNNGTSGYQSNGVNQVPQLPTAHLAGSSGTTLSYYKSAYQNSRDLQFKPSPFYSVISRVGEVRTCDVMQQHRNTISISIRANENPSLANLANDKSYRLMLFCASGNSGLQDIAFPHQSEFKVNGGEIKANLRGLKGKPGTTRPVDVTDSLRLKPINYNNSIEFTYALTDKVKKLDPSPAATKFYLAAYICQVVSVDDLVTQVSGRKIAKSTVIKEMTRKANDPDVVATSTVLSLKCPLSYTRLRTPCRSISCNHIQCFDASSYLLLQQQGPQWICPICNQSAPFENLAVDEYARDILDKTADSVEQVTIEPDGQWTTHSNEVQPRKRRGSSPHTNIDIDDDVSVVTENPTYSNGGFSTPRGFSTPSRALIGGTPGSGSREPSGAPRSASKKRSAAEVIDLTLSSDEDEPPERPVKKQNMGPSSNYPIGSVRPY